MKGAARIGFRISSSEIRNNIFVPKYYDPDIDSRLEELHGTHELVTVQQLLDEKRLAMWQGKYIGKMHYGTGPVPYIRTSDIANWELRGSPKHGVTEALRQRWKAKQDVRANDVLLVHEGTYLIGTPCLLTRWDTHILFQHHLAKLRVLDEEELSGPLLVAALLAPVVQRQIRSKQLTADVIDSIVGRFPEVVLPLPSDPQRRLALSIEAREIFEGRARLRVQLASIARGLDEALRRGEVDALEGVVDDDDPEASGLISFLGDRAGFQAFRISTSDISGDTLVPRYYNPGTVAQLAAMADACELVSIHQLVQEGALSLTTGHEVGKLAYGTGSIPFVRTSDLANWELKHDPKQRVSRAIFDAFAPKQSVQAEDVLVVRDGTYLVGTSAIVAESDLPLLISGGVYRVRVHDSGRIDPFLLLALLNTQVVKRQVRDKQFTRDVIDTLGHRFEEIVLPIPRSADVQNRLTKLVRTTVERRVGLRDNATKLGRNLEAVNRNVR